MKRLAVAFWVALLIHGAGLWVLSTVDDRSARMTLKQGKTSVTMAFQAASASAKPTYSSSPDQSSRSNRDQPISEPAEKSPDRSPATDQATPTPTPTETQPSEAPRPSQSPSTSSNRTSSSDSAVKKQDKQPDREQSLEATESSKSEANNSGQTSSESNSENQQNNDGQSTVQAPASVATKGAKWVDSVEYQENPPPQYPTKARVMGIEGTVKLLVTIDPEGHPTSIEVFKGSGSFRLDDAAMEAVREWSFVPAREAGEPVKSKTIVPVRFRLED